ncbi:MAG: mannose-1-phosphate guanylyltransferase [Bacteroidetes bacterium]|nr:mannose-1-phosphate guanylyltransferase [Bacteroidota bacterium]
MTDHKHHYVLIMAGGIGSRFWPVSRRSMPKQFIDILGTGESLIAQTYRRFESIVPRENIFIVTNQEYANLVNEHIPGIDPSRVLLEPQARNTAPCIAYASFCIQRIDPEAICVVAPSDHLITNEAEFQRTIEKSYTFAAGFDCLITLGIQPTRPDTGYGYIQFNPIPSGQGFHEVKTFTEKPTLELARSFIDSGEFLWNAGIFAWSIKSIMHRLETHEPEIFQIFSEVSFESENFGTELEKAYSLCPSISIDYGVLEKDDQVYVYPSTFGWNDLGTWKSLWSVSEQDEHQSVKIGKHIHAYDTTGSLVFSNTGRVVITSGIDNLVVVDSDDVILVMHRDREQDLRNIVNDMRDEFKGKLT